MRGSDRRVSDSPKFAPIELSEADQERVAELLHPKLICNARWMAPRVEVESVPVMHVCALKYKHEGVCACSCGRIRLERKHE